MKKSKVKKVRAWAVISNGKIAPIGMFYQPEMTLLSLSMAKEMIKNGIYVDGDGYEPKIVPCTITYKLPSNKKKQ